jgi:para-nitrobenzyl esterase
MQIKSVLRIGSLAGVALLAGAGAWAQSDVVRIESGTIKGSQQNGVLAFKGIPFAAPPVGPLRWRPPQPVAAWSGTRPAKDYGPDCMQLPFPSDAAPLGGPVNEDCLYLNIWKPAAPSSRKLPVMVWIYGGGFVNGGTSPAVYDGKHFAEDGVIFVSINYRIGRFGFFAHPALTQEHPDEPHGNYGYMDQIAGLKWVQKNIAAFGGDPNQVTVFGESAGGGSVLMLLTSPMAQGLFQRAIVESGGGRDPIMGERYLSNAGPRGMPSAEDLGIAFAKSAGITDTGAAGLAQLRDLPADKIVAGLNLAAMFGGGAATYSGPVIDGRIVREGPEAALLTGRWAKVPVMIGANSADIGFPMGRTIDELIAPFGTNAEKAKAAYDPDRSGNVMMVGTRISMDQIMVEPSRFVARTVAAQGLPAYEYRFSYVAESLRAKLPGAPHATEIPYVFYTVDAAYKDKLTAHDSSASKTTHQYWVNFAKTGDPSGAGLPAWPTQNPKTDIIMDFTNSGPVAGPDPWKARLDLTAAKVEQSKANNTKAATGQN